MDITQDEIERVKESLRASYKRDALEGPSQEDNINALICFSEWWRNEYSGGFPSKKQVVDYIGLPGDAEKNIYKAAVAGLELLHIKPIHSIHEYELRFRTMLLQGGIPKNILFGDNESRFLDFLTSLLEEVYNKVIDWDDATIVESMDCKHHLPHSFQKEDIYAISLDIVHAVDRDRYDLLPFDASKNDFMRLVDTLRRAKTSIEKRRAQRPLTFRWELGIKDEDATLYYTLDNLKKIPAESVHFSDQDVYQFNVEVNGRRVGIYRRSQNNYDRISSSNARVKWEGEAYLDVRAVTNDLSSCSLPAANNCPPDLSKPQVFNYDGTKYVQRNTDNSSKSVVIFDGRLWKVPDDTDRKKVTLDGKEYLLCEFNGSVTLESLAGEEPMTVKNIFTDYFSVVTAAGFEWQETANYTVIKGNPKIEAYSDDGPADSNQVKVFFKKRSDNEWSVFSNRTILPFGVITLRIVYPDGKGEEKSFYNVAGLTIRIDSENAARAVVTATSPRGRILFHETQDGMIISPAGRDKWVLTRDLASPIVPDKFVFSIIDEDSPDLIMSIPCPFTVFLLKDKLTGRAADPEAIISLSELDRYSIVQRDQLNPSILIKYSKEDSIKEVKATLRFSVKDHITPLSKFEPAINSILDLNAHNIFNRDEGAILSIGGENYKIRPFVLDSQLDGDRLTITGDEDPVGRSFFACELGESVTEGMLSVKQLPPFSNNMHLDEQNPALPRMPFIIFSSPSDRKRLIPKLICNNPREVRASGSKEVWITRLKDDDPSYGLAWREVANAFEIATDFNLPYKTFNQICAAVSTPELLCKFLFAMFCNNKMEKVLYGIVRLEQEFSVAVHWIRSTVWAGEADKCLVTNNDYQEFFMALSRLIDLTGGCSVFIARGPSNTSGGYHFTTEEVNQLRALANHTLHDGAATPRKRMNPNGTYLPEVVRGTMRAEQYCLIYSPILVSEYLLGKREDLWDDNEDAMETRRVISFYSREFYTAYNDILVKELQ